MKEKFFEPEINFHKKVGDKLKDDILRQMRLGNIKRELEHNTIIQNSRVGQATAEAKKMLQAKMANLMSSYRQRTQ